MVLYRGTVEAPQYLDGQTMVVIGDKRLRLVSYPISRELQATGQGHSHINWIGRPMTEDEAPRGLTNRVNSKDSRHYMRTGILTGTTYPQPSHQQEKSLNFRCTTATPETLDSAG